MKNNKIRVNAFHLRRRFNNQKNRTCKLSYNYGTQKHLANNKNEIGMRDVTIDDAVE
jgi:hypothetical protein